MTTKTQKIRMVTFHILPQEILGIIYSYSLLLEDANGKCHTHPLIDSSDFDEMVKFVDEGDCEVEFEEVDFDVGAVIGAMEKIFDPSKPDKKNEDNGKWSKIKEIRLRKDFQISNQPK